MNFNNIIQVDYALVFSMIIYCLKDKETRYQCILKVNQLELGNPIWLTWKVLVHVLAKYCKYFDFKYKSKYKYSISLSNESKYKYKYRVLGT